MGERFVVMCDECGMECRTDALEEAIVFSVNHRRHTGHTLSWETVELDSVVTIPQRTRWKVRCDTCETERQFGDRDDAETFYDEHETYAGHPPDAIEEVTLPALDEIGADDVEAVLDYCFEHAGSAEVVPADAIVTAFEEAGLTRTRAAKQVAVAEQDLEVTHADDGLLMR